MYLAVGRMVALGFERRKRKSPGRSALPTLLAFLKGSISLSLTVFVPCRGRPLTPDTRTPGGIRKGSNFRNAPYCALGGVSFPIRREKTMAEKCKPYILFECNFGGTKSHSVHCIWYRLGILASCTVPPYSQHPSIPSFTIYTLHRRFVNIKQLCH